MQKIHALSNEMLIYISVKRDWVKNHYTSESVNKYETIEGKLHLLDVILQSDWINAKETVKLQNLGITLGDVFVQDLGFEWIQVEDEYGSDPALQLFGSSILLFPLTMISKRIERNEVLDIYEFYGALKNEVNKICNT